MRNFSIRKLGLLILFIIISIILTLFYHFFIQLSDFAAVTFLTLTIWLTFIVVYEKLNQLRSSQRLSVFKNQTLDTLLSVSELFMGMDESDEYYDLILKSAIKVIKNASKGSFLVHNPLTGRYEYKACFGYDFDTLKKVTFTLEETFLFKNAHGDYDKPVITQNIAAHDNKLLDPLSVANILDSGGLDIQEALSAPIVIDGKIMAILNIDSERDNAFDETDTHLIHFFASQIAIALKHKGLLDETISLSRYDKLTGAYNRNYFEKIFNAHRHQSLENMEPYALVLCDLNYLKNINDTYGHTAGDRVLIEFSEMILESTRESDVFSRIGGDEFIILLRNIDFTHAQLKMSSIFEKFENHHISYQGHMLPVSFSYGIATSPDDSMIYDILIKIADGRMYEFKDKFKLNNSFF